MKKITIKRVSAVSYVAIFEEKDGSKTASVLSVAVEDGGGEVRSREVMEKLCDDYCCDVHLRLSPRGDPAWFVLQAGQSIGSRKFLPRFRAYSE